jgi:hypothetical protein
MGAGYSHTFRVSSDGGRCPASSTKVARQSRFPLALEAIGAARFGLPFVFAPRSLPAASGLIRRAQAFTINDWPVGTWMMDSGLSAKNSFTAFRAPWQLARP